MTARMPRRALDTVVGSAIVDAQVQSVAPATTATGKTRSGAATSSAAEGTETANAVSDNESAPAARSPMPISKRRIARNRYVAATPSRRLAAAALVVA